MASPTHLTPCRGTGSGPHGYFREVEMIPAKKVHRDTNARGYYCLACAAAKGYR